jgi:hypothetical protein
MGSINADTPRDATGRRKREVSDEQVLDIVVRRVQEQSLRAIEKATGVPRSTISELLRKPDVIAMVAEIQAEEGKHEAAKVDAVSRERKRETSRKSSATHRDKQTREGFAAERERSAKSVLPIRSKTKPSGADGKLLGVFAAPRRGVPGIPDDDGWVVKAGSGGGDYISEDTWRELPREVIGRADVRLANCTYSYEPARAGDPKRVALLIADEPEVAGVPLDDLVAALADVRPGATFALAYEPAPRLGEDPAVYAAELAAQESPR